jgi:hypothetical protein
MARVTDARLRELRAILASFVDGGEERLDEAMAAVRRVFDVDAEREKCRANRRAYLERMKAANGGSSYDREYYLRHKAEIIPKLVAKQRERRAAAAQAGGSQPPQPCIMDSRALYPTSSMSNSGSYEAAGLAP